MRWRVLASGRPRAAPATCSIRASRAFSSRRIASVLASPVAESASAVASRAAICAASSASRSSSVCSARSSSASGGLANRRAAASVPPASGLAPWPDFVCSHCLSTVARCLAREMANASMDESSFCCRPTTSRAAAARARAVPFLRRSSRNSRYRSSRCERTSSGASSGKPSIAMRSTPRSGNPPWTSRMSSLIRLTITSSSAFFPRTGTPRVKAVGVEQLEQGGEAV